MTPLNCLPLRREAGGEGRGEVALIQKVKTFFLNPLPAPKSWGEEE
jgi:hypothetical protein